MATGAGDVVVLVAGVDGGFDLGLTTLLEDTENNRKQSKCSTFTFESLQTCVLPQEPVP